MEIKFECPRCSQEVAADGEMCGTEALCPHCGAEIEVPAPALAPGQALGGFRIERRLGSGAMGEVFLATQLSMDRLVALKVLPPILSRDKEYFERFMNEVRMLGRLNHPHIVTAFEAGSAGPYHYLAMLFVDGESVEQRLEREGSLAERDALPIVLNVADALSYAWDSFQVLHRDIKPANIMVDKAGVTHLMDMGISKRASENTGVTMAGFVVGTPHYMSPEQAKGSAKLDFRSDMYSLGATLYHLVAGRVPFAGEGTVEVLSKLLAEPPPPVREINPKVSECCAELLTRMMMKKPEDRYPNWGELITDIKLVQKGKHPKYCAHPAAPAAAAGRAATPAPAPRKSKAPVWAMAVVAAAVLGIIGLVALNRKPEPAAPGSGGTAVAVPPVRPDNPPPNKNTGTTVPTPDPAAVRLKALRDMWAAAERFERDNPRDFDGTLRQYRAVAEDAAGTEYKLKANDAVERVEKAKTQAIAAVVTELDAQATKLVAEEKFTEAQALWREYTAEFATETAAEREKAAVAIAAKQQEVQAAKTAATAAAGEKVAGLVKEVAADLLKQDLRQASLRVAEARKQADLAQDEGFRQLAAEVDALGGLPEALRESFRQDQASNKAVTVELKSGKRELEVTQVMGNEVKARRRIKTSRGEAVTTETFKLGDLTDRECLARLARRPDAPGTKLMRAFILIQGAKRREAIVEALEQAGTPLASAMHDQLAAVAGVKSAAQQAEEQALEAFRDLLRSADLPPGEKEAAALVELVAARPYGEADLKQIKEEATKFQEQYAQSEVARTYAAVVTRLLEATPFSKSKVDAVLGQLVAANPPLKNGFKQSYKLADGKFELFLENNPGLTDIRALKGLPLTKLALNNTRVRDLSPLKGMPLDDLGLWNCTTIDDLRPLRGMPLTVLSLNKTGVTDLKDLKGMQLTWLDLSSTAIEDISILKGMPLQQIKLEGCDKLTDLSPLEGCQDLTAIIVPLKAKRISFLRKLPNIRNIGTKWDENEMTADDFWKRYGARYQ